MRASPLPTAWSYLMFYDTSQQLMSLIFSANDAVCSNEAGHFSFRFLLPISPHWISKTKECFPSLCCNESNTFDITLSVLLRGSLNKIQKINKHHLRSLPTELKKSARWTPRSKTLVAGWSRKVPLSLLQHHAMNHTGAWGYCFIQSWHYVKGTLSFASRPLYPQRMRRR